MLPYEACNLGSINVTKFINEEGTDLDWDSFTDTVRVAVRFLDNVIDANHFPIPQIRKVTLGNRKIGLGIMGFADTLVLLGIRYDSKEAVEFAKKLASTIQKHAHRASEELAGERGCFPNFKGSIWDTKHHRPMRNATSTTIAPTGSISIICGGCSGGIEPIFSIIYERRALDGQKFRQLNPLVEELGIKGGWLSGKIRKLLNQGILPKDIPEISRLDMFRYDYQQTQRLIERVQDRWYGPTSCKTIRNQGFYCPKFGQCRVKAPTYLTALYVKYGR